MWRSVHDNQHWLLVSNGKRTPGLKSWVWPIYPPYVDSLHYMKYSSGLTCNTGVGDNKKGQGTWGGTEGDWVTTV